MDDTWRSDDGVMAWSALLRAHGAAVRRIERDLRSGSGLPLGWYDVLLELTWADGGRMRMAELGDRAVLSRTRISRIVAELEREGLVRREANTEDARSSYASVTTAGRRALRAASPVYLEAVRRWFVGAVRSADVPVVRRALEAVADGAAPDVI
jgi:DNA-binding MarR family transcriptional regulator